MGLYVEKLPFNFLCHFSHEQKKVEIPSSPLSSKKLKNASTLTLEKECTGKIKFTEKNIIKFISR